MGWYDKPNGLICEYCSKPLVRQQYKYCSNQCKGFGSNPRYWKGKEGNRKGATNSEEHNCQIAKALVGNKNSEGRFVSIETRMLISKAQKGEKSYNWKGGITGNPYDENFTSALKEEVRKRDNYTCQSCGLREENHITKLGKWERLRVHHIDENKQNSVLENLTTLCSSCHGKVHTMKTRKGIQFLAKY